MLASMMLAGMEPGDVGMDDVWQDAGSEEGGPSDPAPISFGMAEEDVPGVRVCNACANTA